MVLFKIGMAPTKNSMTVFELQSAFRSFVVCPSLQLHHFMSSVMQPPKFEFMFMISVLKENSGLVSLSGVRFTKRV